MAGRNVSQVNSVESGMKAGVATLAAEADRIATKEVEKITVTAAGGKAKQSRDDPIHKRVLK